jgi:SEL1 protein
VPSTSEALGKEAALAHSQALQTLSALSAAQTQSSDPYSHSSSSTQRSILSSFFGSLLPTPNQRGPIATTLRILQRLRQQSWMPRLISTIAGFGISSGKGSSGRRRNDEMRGRAVKIIDLLEHAIELGNIEALYSLGRVSLVSALSIVLLLH